MSDIQGNIPRAPRLKGVHHTARPTWKLRETVEFYRDILGLDLVHCVSARGWGEPGHPDFLHFFFDSRAGGTIAFFYYLGHDQPDHLIHRAKFDSDAVHTAWLVESREELLAWRERLEGKGVPILFQVEHEVVESLYFRDPNGYFLELAWPLRDFRPIDKLDAQLTLEAAIAVEERFASRGDRLKAIEDVWHEKGEQVAALVEAAQ